MGAELDLGVLSQPLRCLRYVGSMDFPRRRHVRWAVPVIVIAATIGAASISNLVSANAQVPNLPSLTPAELLAKVTTAKVPAFSGTVQLSANLGLPDLGGFGGSVPGTLTDLLAGSHTATVAADGPTKVKVTMDGQLAESSWIRNGQDAWSWNSQTQTASHATESAPPAGTADKADPADANAGAEAMNPSTMASTVLARVDPTTTVSVRTSAYVAGRAAYELVLAPKSAASTVSEVVLAVDAATGTPLDVRIIAKGQSSPALELGFTAITFAAPSASTFVFTPPPGITVKEVASMADLLPISESHHRRDNAANRLDAATSTATTSARTAGNNTKTVGTGWDSVKIMTTASISPQIARTLSGGKTVSLAGGVTANVVSTALLNAMLTSDGRLAIGAVTPQALQAALSQPAA